MKQSLALLVVFGFALSCSAEAGQKTSAARSAVSICAEKSSKDPTAVFSKIEQTCEADGILSVDRIDGQDVEILCTCKKKDGQFFYQLVVGTDEISEHDLRCSIEGACASSGAFSMHRDGYRAEFWCKRALVVRKLKWDPYKKACVDECDSGWVWDIDHQACRPECYGGEVYDWESGLCRLEAKSVRR